MIDIHTHLLFGVDDGCKTIEDSVKMIESAFSNGITDIILTPHYSYLRKYTVNMETMNTNYLVLKEELKKRKIKMNLYLGSEIDQTNDIFDFLENKKCHTLNDTKYILVDFGMQKCRIDDYCYELVVKGYTPIIAHPERYRYVTDISDYKKWRSTGALIQVNAGSFYSAKDSQTKKMAKLALKHKLIDFIASDTHMNGKRFYYLKKIHQYVISKYGNKYADKVFIDNPKRLGVKYNEY